MIVLVIVYSIPLVKVYKRRNTAEMTPRSPKLILMYLGYLMLDSLMNTILFSINPAQKTALVCFIGVFCTVICQFGIMTTVFLRMYRIYAVFSAYELYLTLQKQDLLKEDPAESAAWRQKMKRKTGDVELPKFNSYTPDTSFSAQDQPRLFHSQPLDESVDTSNTSINS